MENLPGQNVLDLTGRTDLSQAMDVLAGSDLLLTNDSGLMHLGGAVGVPLVAVFGPTNPLATGPLAKKQLILRSPVPCAPCRHRQCPKAKKICFNGLTPDLVALKTLEFLNAPVPGPKVIFTTKELLNLPDSLNRQDPQNPQSPQEPLLPKEKLITLSPDINSQELFLLAQEKGFNLADCFFVGDRDNFLSQGSLAGAQTVLVLTQQGLKILPQALNEIRPALVVPTARFAWEWIDCR
jgi:hypothetical protein